MECADQTMIFNKSDLKERDIPSTLLHVYDSLLEKGYNPINQIVGYLMSGDPAYIPRHNDSRSAIRHYERDEVLEEMLKAFLKQQGRL